MTFAYVTNFGSDNVSVIDTKTHSVIASVTVGMVPQDVAFTPDGKIAYVTNSGSIPGTVSAIDTKTHSVIASVTVGDRPNTVAFAPN